MSLRDTYETSFDEACGKTMSATECPECSGRIETDGGEVTCGDCGLIVNEYWIDHAATAQSYPDAETASAQTGAPLTATRHDRGLSTEIGYKRDGYGNALSGRTRRQFRRLRHHQNRARYTTKQRQNLAFACGEIARLASALDFGWDVREQACTLYRQAMSDDLIRGRSIEAMAAASVYAVCRCTGSRRTLAEVASNARVSESRVKNAYRVINTELGLETAIIRPRTLLPRLISDLDFPLSPMVRRRAEELVCRAESTGIANGRRPSGVAAACLYVALKESNRPVRQTDLAEMAGTTPTTIRARCEELRAHTAD
ncbi:transcription initiation factor IIB [Salinigranum halophilum]|uniref:transcription initiation factor IIB n=1 Tax=Salinigranum halophilum TaxID=2565931 RepID=UPI00115F5929|nr:transcription initiation factor IIB family protein [Salinigranum halophilum]